MDVFVMITDIGTVVLILVIAVVSTNLLEKSIAASDCIKEREREEIKRELCPKGRLPPSED